MKPSAENWEKEFDNEVDRLIARSMRDPSSKPLTKIKSFIRTLLARSLEEQRGRIGEKREELAELEHDQWIAWSKNIAETENITPARLERWKILWRPYSELTEAEKNQDREWADKVLQIIQNMK